MEFEVHYRRHEDSLPITYEVAIQVDESGRPYVSEEKMYEDRGDISSSLFLFLDNGQGVAWKGSLTGGEMEDTVGGFDFTKFSQQVEAGKESEEAEFIELEDRRKLGIATLGALKQHPRISAFRRFIEGWYLSYFTAGRRSPACRWLAPRNISASTATI